MRPASNAYKIFFGRPIGLGWRIALTVQSCCDLNSNCRPRWRSFQFELTENIVMQSGELEVLKWIFKNLSRRVSVGFIWLGGKD